MKFYFVFVDSKNCRKIFQVRKNVSIITPEDSYSIEDHSNKCSLSSIYPNVDHFVLSSYTSDKDGYYQILRHVFIRLFSTIYYSIIYNREMLKIIKVTY